MRSLPAFLLRVLTDPRRNRGLLPSGAVAYYTLLSILPLFVLLLVGLSHVVSATAYGSLAAAIVVLLTLEMAALIMLLGARGTTVIDRERGQRERPDLAPCTIPRPRAERRTSRENW
jgi:uncharacterized BrkB/YihY/UPF0761 family membrane protein